MTPSAMTAAGRATSARASTRPVPDHRRQLRRRPAPAAPRRVSGPSVAQPRRAPSRGHHATVGTRALALVRSLPEHSLVDRLVRGRAWIPVLGLLLAGIVAMQVEVLKLGTSIGRYVQRSAALQTQNESLQASVASLNDDQRIVQLATGMGMVMSAPTTIAFLHAAPSGDATQALSNIHAPDPAGFAGQLAAQAAAAAAAAAPQGVGATSSSQAAATTASSAAAATAATQSTQTTQTTAAGSAAPAAPAAPATQAPASSASTGAPSQSSSSGAAAIAPPGSSRAGGSTGG